jgi:L-alanine-DL-glutamate epimerase-like enolase superfamily enzyme
MQEYLVKWNTVNQFFIKHKLTPVDGWLTPPDLPGLGIEIDEAVIEDETVLD